MQKSEILDILEKNRAVLLYFSSNDCSVCKVLKEKVKDSISRNFPKVEFFEISSKENLQVCADFGVLSFPTILLFFDSKEFKRYGRNISLNIFNIEVSRLYKMVFEV